MKIALAALLMMTSAATAQQVSTTANVPTGYLVKGPVDYTLVKHSDGGLRVYPQKEACPGVTKAKPSFADCFLARGTSGDGVSPGKDKQ
jgi:hypothetical protein